MVDFTMSARAVYPDGVRGEVFARVSGVTPVACFAAMAAEVARWMPPERHDRAGEAPQALELTFGWLGDAQTSAAPVLPRDPRGEGRWRLWRRRRNGRRPRGGGRRCAAAERRERPGRPLPCAGARSPIGARALRLGASGPAMRS
jgi:hypothetical protein